MIDFSTLTWHDYAYSYEITDIDLSIISELNIEALVFDDSSVSFAITKNTMVSMILKNDDYKFTYYPNKYVSEDVPSIWFKVPKFNENDKIVKLYSTLNSMVVVDVSPNKVLLKMINNRRYWDNKYKTLLNNKETLFYSVFLDKIIPIDIILKMRDYETK